MATRKDEDLNDPKALERLHYETGVLLAADDLRAEQTYHRGRLARALAALHGSGTVAGLKVEDEVVQGARRLVVRPGLAIDPVGRLIEIPGAVCVDLRRWFDDGERQETEAMNHAWHGAPYGGVVADVLLRFAACPRGKTPAFATGPYEALDAVVPARIADAYELELRLRPDIPATEDTDKPEPLLKQVLAAADAKARNKLLRDAIFGAWPPPAGELGDLSVLLARVVFAADAPASGVRPVWKDTVTIDNDVRPFSVALGVLAGSYAP